MTRIPRGPCARHYLTPQHRKGGPTVEPGWYIVDTSYRPERILTRTLTYEEAHDPRTLERIRDRVGRIEW